MDFIRVEREEGGVAVLTIDRQEKLNALDQTVVEEMGQALLELEAEGPRAVIAAGGGGGSGGVGGVGRGRRGREAGGPRAIIVTGAGDRSFIAGADISAMSTMGPLEAKRFSEIGHAATAPLDRRPAPTTAAAQAQANG